jgi:hypothetical protein
MSGTSDRQISNRNYLSPIGFKFSLAKEPKVAFFCNSARLPEITLATSIQPSYLKNIDIPGEKITYGNFTLRYLVDESLENYMAIHNWITGLGFPETTEQYTNLTTNEDGLREPLVAFSDGTLRILNSNYRDVAIIKFKDLFPVSLTPLEFNASETTVNYFTADVTFKYTVYNILGTDGNPL